MSVFNPEDENPENLKRC